MERLVEKLEPPIVTEKEGKKLDKMDIEIKKIYTSFNELRDILNDDTNWDKIIIKYFLKSIYKDKLFSEVDFLDELPADVQEDKIFYVYYEDEEARKVRHITKEMLTRYLLVIRSWIKRQESTRWDLGGFKVEAKSRLEKIQDEGKTPIEKVPKETFEISPSTDLTHDERIYLLKKINEYSRFPQYTKKVISAIVSGERTTSGIMKLTDIKDSTTVYTYMKFYLDAGWVTSRREGRKNMYEIDLDVIMADLDIESLSETSEGD